MARSRESKGRRKLRQSLASRGIRLNSRVAPNQTHDSDDDETSDEDFHLEAERRAEGRERGNRDNDIDAEAERIKLTGESLKTS